jgi:hypothetical protein
MNTLNSLSNKSGAKHSLLKSRPQLYRSYTERLI